MDKIRQRFTSLWSKEEEPKIKFQDSIIQINLPNEPNRPRSSSEGYPLSHQELVKSHLQYYRQFSEAPLTTPEVEAMINFNMQYVKEDSRSGSPVKETNQMTKEVDHASGFKMINQYLIKREIGRGCHGKVKLAMDTITHDQVAIKIVVKQKKKRFGSKMDWSEESIKIRREIAILKKCIHPHVVRLIEVIDSPDSNKIYMVLEYLEGGEIQWHDEFDRPVMDQDMARSIFRDIILGIEYLHYQGIVHRDIKPANILMSANGIAKISDFGVSFLHYMDDDEGTGASSSELNRTAGSPAFFAPELCQLDDKNTKITQAIDIWALGVTLYCFIFGKIPFDASNEFELLSIIPKQKLSFPFQVGSQLKDLLKKLMEKNPEKRITIQELKNHPWVIADLEWQPQNISKVEVNEQDIEKALTFMGKLKQHIRRLSSSIQNFSFISRGLTKTSSMPKINGFDTKLVKRHSRGESLGKLNLPAPLFQKKQHEKKDSIDEGVGEMFESNDTCGNSNSIPEDLETSSFQTE